MHEFSLRHRLFESKFGPWLRLMRFDRPIGLVLLLWPTWWALFAAAQGWPSIQTWIIFTLGVVVMRSAGCVINDYFDRDIDPQVTRTQTRPLASGEITPKGALVLFVVLMSLAFGLVALTNPLTMGLAVMGALLATTYPLFKRFTHMPQAVLGLAFAWAIPMAYAAETGHVPFEVLWWMGLNVIWVLIYDTQYAMADRADDLKVGIKSTAIALGRFDVVGIGLLMALMLIVMSLMGLVLIPSPVWWVGVVLVALLLARQLWMIHHREPQACFQAFLDNHWVGLVIFLSLLGSLLLSSNQA